MEREVGGGIGMGNTCKPMAISFQCMTKSTTIKKKKERQKKNNEKFIMYLVHIHTYSYLNNMYAYLYYYI